MKNIARMSLRKARNLLTLPLAVKTRKNLTVPEYIAVMFTERCNARCLMCRCYEPPYNPELTIDQWKHIFGQLKDWLGTFHVQIGGGEPTLRKNDLIELMEYSKNNGIIFGFVTNGFLVDEPFADVVTQSSVFNVNISIDSLDDEKVAYIRGIKDTHAKEMRAIRNLIKYKKKNNARTNVIMKTIIMGLNLDELEEMVSFVENEGLTGVYFQPLSYVGPKDRKTYPDGFWPEDNALLAEKLEKIIELQKAGAPVLTPRSHLESYYDYYNGKFIQSESECTVGFRNMFIDTNGDVSLCHSVPDKVVGNIVEQHPRDIWYSEKAHNKRLKLLNCRQPCMKTCTSKRTLLENLRFIRQLLWR